MKTITAYQHFVNICPAELFEMDKHFLNIFFKYAKNAMKSYSPNYLASKYFEVQTDSYVIACALFYALKEYIDYHYPIEDMIADTRINDFLDELIFCGIDPNNYMPEPDDIFCECDSYYREGFRFMFKDNRFIKFVDTAIKYDFHKHANNSFITLGHPMFPGKEPWQVYKIGYWSDYPITSMIVYLNRIHSSNEDYYELDKYRLYWLRVLHLSEGKLYSL